MRQLFCFLLVSFLHLTVQGQEIVVEKTLPFAPFDTIANGRLLVTSLKNVNSSLPLATSCNCRLVAVSIGYLPEKGDYHEFGKVQIENGKLPTKVQRIFDLKPGDKLFLSDLEFACKKGDCAKGYNIGPISLKVVGR